MGLIDDLTNKLQFSTQAKEFAQSVTVINDANYKLADGLVKTIAVNEAWAKSYEDVINQSLQLELRNKALNSAFSISTTAAAKLSQTYYKVAEQFKISGEQVMKYGINLKKIAPLLNQNNAANSVYIKGLLATQKILTTNLGLSEQTAEEYTYLATQQGQNATQTILATKALVDAIDPTGDLGLFKEVADSIAKAGADIQLQFGKVPGRLELASLKATQLGLELTALKNTGKQLLNIESSIGDELEYQLLSGRRLTDASGNSLTNAYRMAMVQGDMNKQADLMNRILDTEGETLETNMFAREQMAKMLGMEEGTLSRSIQKRKILEKLKAEGGLDLFDESGANLINEAREAFQRGAMTDEDFQKLMDLEDKRTTDDLIKEQLKVQQETLYYTILQTQQKDIITKNAGAALANAKDLKLSKDFTDLRLQKLSELITSNEVSQGTLKQDTLVTGAGNAKMNADGTVIKEEDALRVNDGLIRFNPRDQFMNVNDGAMIAGTNVDGNKKLAASINGAGASITNAHISQLIQAFNEVGLLMKNAIDSQTNTLKRDNLFAPGINGATWE